ncbi:MAG: mannose-1-phosphate guanylyltransferase/mannose-6-phosphate isomerase [Rhodocyclaceae bacterium]|nr:mannose-1-phosphate guanylyltransferase/mannose-6-phosphate isomerase [Rhodocyclaceae bacterium]
MNVHPVILCGGVGTRLWPLSRDASPKQFLPLLRGRSPFEATLERLRHVAAAPPLIVANCEHRFAIEQQAQAVGAAAYELCLEPCGRGTAPAVAIAAHRLLRDDADAAMLILPADHDIPDAQAFAAAVAQGAAALQAGRLVVFGLPASRAETGYGYIERGAALPGADNCHEVAGFVEKPELQIARRLAASGRHYWNSGIFLFGAAHYLAELERFEPELAAACGDAAASLTAERGCLCLDAAAFARCRAASVDHAVLERTAAGAMVAASFAWSDIGSWHALWAHADKDSQGNVAHGDVHLHDVADSYVHSTRRMVVGIGLRDMVIVETEDALLVASREHAHEVKEAVERLRTQDRDECRAPHRVVRPWGHYEDIDAGERFRVKRITVNPGGRLSLQLHHHRAEHWVVVRGTARVTCGDAVSLLGENQSTYIPIGVTHRLENPGKIPLEVIETQSGSYLREDDIVRLHDVYQRA